MFKAVGIGYRTCVGITENPVRAMNSVDVISDKGRTALAVIDDPACDPAGLIGQIPKAIPGELYPVMLLPSDDGSCWDDARETWAGRVTDLMPYLIDCKAGLIASCGPYPSCMASLYSAILLRAETNSKRRVKFLEAASHAR